jgi:hypothetical protein
MLHSRKSPEDRWQPLEETPMHLAQLSTVVLDGVLTRDATERVAEAIAALHPGGALLIDVSRASELEAVVLARLARLLQIHGGSISVRICGLRHREHQLLGYLGLELDGSGAPVSASAPPSARN